MLAEDRLGRIARLIHEQGSVTVSELMERFSASESTIRRDLTRLEAQGCLTRVHGGATAAGRTIVPADLPMHERTGVHIAEKTAIARHAASLIAPEDFVYIDAGTTTEILASLVTETRATYVTNSINVARILLDKGCRVVVLGGVIKPVTVAIVGERAVSEARRYHFTMGFFGANGAAPETGFTTPELDEAAIKETVIGQTIHPYILCDASKFASVSPVTFASFESCTVITEEVPQGLEGYGNIVVASAAAEDDRF